jgi:peptide/nickel transport system ATP-binding protein
MEIGPAERVIRSPHNPYTQALVSVSPTPEPPTPGDRARRTILVGETPDAAQVPTGCRFHPRCPYAFDRCRTEEPPLFDVGAGQSAACWLVEGGGTLPAVPPRRAAASAVVGRPADGVAADDGAVPPAQARGAPSASLAADGSQPRPQAPERQPTSD